MNRLFTFGCSFTQYFWPTWADLISNQFDEFHNWGLSGFGNPGISSSVAEADARNKFNSNDTIIVMWTNTYREDRYIDNDWFRKGHLLHGKHEYPEGYVDKYVQPKGCFIRDMAQIHLVKKLLDNSGCTYYFTSMSKLEEDVIFDQYESVWTDVIDVYKDLLKIFRPSVSEVLYGDDPQQWSSRKWNGGPVLDYHPLPHEYAKFVQEVFPEYKLDDVQLCKAENYSNFIMNTFKTHNDQPKISEKFGKNPFDGIKLVDRF